MVAQASEPAVSPTSESPSVGSPRLLQAFAGMEACDTAGSQACATGSARFKGHLDLEHWFSGRSAPGHNAMPPGCLDAAEAPPEIVPVLPHFDAVS